MSSASWFRAHVPSDPEALQKRSFAEDHTEGRSEAPGSFEKFSNNLVFQQQSWDSSGGQQEDGPSATVLDICFE